MRISRLKWVVNIPFLSYYAVFTVLPMNFVDIQAYTFLMKFQGMKTITEIKTIIYNAQNGNRFNNLAISSKISPLYPIFDTREIHSFLNSLESTMLAKVLTR